MSPTPCAACRGKRLRPESLAVKVGDYSIAEFTALSSRRRAPGRRQNSARPHAAPACRSPAAPLDEVAERLDFLLAVGLDYLSLDRSAATLSGGEAQRIRLATQIGSQPARRALCSRRAFHRPASARQRPPARHARTPCATWATPSSSSSTTKKPFAAPIT